MPDLTIKNDDTHATPGSGYTKLYPKTDKLFYLKDDTGTESPLSGETNTVSNIGTGGVGVFKQKTGVDFEFKKINAGSNKVAITDDVGDDELDVDLNEGNIVHQNLSGAGTNTHANIDTHIGSTSNPHSVTKTQVGLANVTNDAQIKQAIGTAKGDLIGFTASNTPVRIPVGTNDFVLTADSGESLGVKWAAASGGSGFPTYNLYADQLEAPNNSDWTVNALAPASADSDNNALTVRRFDDTTEEGVGALIQIPTGATNIIFDFKSRPQTGHATNTGVRPKLYVREIPDNAAVESWSSGTLMTALTMGTSNTFFQYDSQTITLASLSLVAGRLAQIELTRLGTDGSDTLAGDWNLLQLNVSFS